MPIAGISHLIFLNTCRFLNQLIGIQKFNKFKAHAADGKNFKFKKTKFHFCFTFSDNSTQTTLALSIFFFGKSLQHSTNCFCALIAIWEKLRIENNNAETNETPTASGEAAEKGQKKMGKTMFNGID